MTEPTTPTETVVTALAAVMAELPSIPKADKAPEGAGGYQYRGIEALTREIQPLLAKHRIVIVPTVTVTDVRPCPGMREGWHDVHMSVEWRICHQSANDYLIARTTGIGRDNSDKGANKAQTQAFKYLLLHLLCIADRKDDADGQTYDAGRSEPAAAEPTITGEQADKIRDRIATIPDEEARKVCRKLFVKKFGTGAAQLPSSRLDEAHEWLDGYTPKAEPVPLPDDGRALIEETIAGATDMDTVRAEFVERYGPIEALTTATADAAVAWLVNRLTVEKLEPAKKAAAKKAAPRRRAGNRRVTPEPTPVAEALTDAIGGES